MPPYYDTQGPLWATCLFYETSRFHSDVHAGYMCVGKATASVFSVPKLTFPCCYIPVPALFGWSPHEYYIALSMVYAFDIYNYNVYVYVYVRVRVHIFVHAYIYVFVCT